MFAFQGKIWFSIAMKIKFIAFVSLIILVPAAWSKEMQISCAIDGHDHFFIYILDLEKLIAKQVDTVPAHQGKLKILENLYIVTLPKTSTRWANNSLINRYSGDLEVELGMPPFGEYKEGNWFLTGQCKKSNSKKLF